MARAYAVTPRTFGLALMATQIGYACGMLLLVPLGDGRERRGLLVTTALAAAAALVGLALAPTFPLLVAAALVVGFASSLPQMIVPFAVGLVAPARRGAVIGTVMGGLLAGILLSRTAAGALGRLVGFRVTFALAAAMMLVLAIVLRAALPEQHPESRAPWATLIRSLPPLVRDEPLLRRHGVIGALGFACFSVFWSTLAFHLARVGRGSEIAGAFGVLGLSGVFVAPMVGRLSGRIAARRINRAALALVAVGFAVFGLFGASLLGLALGVVLLDVGAQANHLSNQTVIYGLRPEQRNRLNAVYMVTYFVGGALGSLLGAWAWSLGGWLAVCGVGAVLAALGVLLAL